MPPSLTNPDLAPTRADQRTWSRWNLAALWVGMSVCIPTYMLAASMIEGGMSWWQAVLTVAIRPGSLPDEIERNPLGLYVTDIQWTKQL